MPKIEYVPTKFKKNSLAMVKQANAIIEEYAQQGFSLTLRQIYYQFVARGLLANKQSEYKRLGEVINNARLAGLIDWLAIVDRTRYLRELSHWNTPGAIIRAAADSFKLDRWANQEYRPEIWIEKDALVGIIEGICNEFDVPYFSCRGYTSQSEMWVAAQRLRKHTSKGQTPLIFHFGDHDPSGIDMTRDITDRMNMFTGGIELKRLALNMDQVEEHQPPPNPAKLTDTRATAYIKEFGNESWELDALNPTDLAALIRNEIESLIDYDKWQETEESETKSRDTLNDISENYNRVVEFLKSV
jgi:hypothetical protein